MSQKLSRFNTSISTLATGIARHMSTKPRISLSLFKDCLLPVGARHLSYERTASHLVQKRYRRSSFTILIIIAIKNLGHPLLSTTLPLVGRFNGYNSKPHCNIDPHSYSIAHVHLCVSASSNRTQSSATTSSDFKTTWTYYSQAL